MLGRSFVCDQREENILCGHVVSRLTMHGFLSHRLVACQVGRYAMQRPRFHEASTSVRPCVEWLMISVPVRISIGAPIGVFAAVNLCPKSGRCTPRAATATVIVREPIDQPEPRHRRCYRSEPRLNECRPARDKKCKISKKKKETK